MLSSQMRWPKLCGCLCSSLAHGFPSSKPFGDKNYLCFSKSGSPNSRMNLKNKGMNRSGSRRRKKRGRVAANPITVAAKWFVPLGEQQIKRCVRGSKDGEELLWGGGWQHQELSSLIFPCDQPHGQSSKPPKRHWNYKIWKSNLFPTGKQGGNTRIKTATKAGSWWHAKYSQHALIGRIHLTLQTWRWLFSKLCC